MPHGPFSLAVVTLAWLAWMAALYQDGCDYAHVTGPVISTRLNSTAPWVEMGLGAWREPTFVAENDQYETNFEGKCQLYPFAMDTIWSLARTLGFLSLCLGGGGTLFGTCCLCIVFSKATWTWTGYLLCLASLCQASNLVWFANSMCDWNTCTLFWGSRLDIVASTLWMLAGMSAVFYYPPRRRIFDDEDDEEKNDEDNDTPPTDWTPGLLAGTSDLDLEENTTMTTMEGDSSRSSSLPILRAQVA